LTRKAGRTGMALTSLTRPQSARPSPPLTESWAPMRRRPSARRRSTISLGLKPRDLGYQCWLTGFVRNCFPWTAKVPLCPRSSSCSSPREKPQECDSSSPWLPMVRADRDAAAATIGVDLPTYNVLVDLQHRDITPEDYETLRHLDRTVKPKTLSLATLNARCPCVPVTSEAVSESDTCSICLESFSVGQHTRRLPCSHVFHANCIDEWLSGSSNLCPEDGLPVFPEP